MTRTLLLSYQDLPYHLKSILLYIVLFPEDYEVECGRLMRLWIAEGLIKQTRGKTVDEVARKYLNALIRRNLIQVAKLNMYGEVRRCRIHDVLREIILSKSEEENFFKVLSEQDKVWQQESMIRHLSIHNSIDNFLWNSRYTSRVRTLLLFRILKLQGNFMNTILSSFKLLRVLDLQGATLGSLPEEVANLFHLRYLSVRKTKARVLPKSIGKLQNLETLDLRSTYVEELSFSMLRLKQLRHLLAFNIKNPATAEGMRVHGRIGSLMALQKLSLIDADMGGARITTELAGLTQLRKLGLHNHVREDGADLCFIIEKMKDLRSLRLDTIYGEFLDLQHLSSPPKLLRRLWLDAHLEELPHWFSSLHNLVYFRMG
uniref:Disease resistance protein RPM1-like n=1 Tax=Nelumbo nucifera TaxID=4432 RepID=A0A822Y125_NELNU|nr:TPA_asm: hypothetical protein HUJ06_026443 [Nelumbo nucifera]